MKKLSFFHTPLFLLKRQNLLPENRANFGWEHRSPKPLCYRPPAKPPTKWSLHLPVGLNPSGSSLPGTHGFAFFGSQDSGRAKFASGKTGQILVGGADPPNPSATAFQINRPHGGRFIFQLV